LSWLYPWPGAGGDPGVREHRLGPAFRVLDMDLARRHVAALDRLPARRWSRAAPGRVPRGWSTCPPDCGAGESPAMSWPVPTPTTPRSPATASCGPSSPRAWTSWPGLDDDDHPVPLDGDPGFAPGGGAARLLPRTSTSPPFEARSRRRHPAGPTTPRTRLYLASIEASTPLATCGRGLQEGRRQALALLRFYAGLWIGEVVGLDVVDVRRSGSPRRNATCA
jgi:hypothetical protein